MRNLVGLDCYRILAYFIYQVVHYLLCVQQILYNPFLQPFSTSALNMGGIIIIFKFPENFFQTNLSLNDEKGCKLFVVHIINNEQIDKEDKIKFDDIPILQDFSDVFLEEILGLPPKRDLDFTIELVPGVVPNSNDFY